MARRRRVVLFAVEGASEAAMFREDLQSFTVYADDTVEPAEFFGDRGKTGPERSSESDGPEQHAQRVRCSTSDLRE
jgi:hypothetical protein